jgi:hypothetical protein
MSDPFDLRDQPRIRDLTHLAERAGIDRRRFLAAASGALGAMVLAACDSMGPRSAASLLKFAERKNESIERLLLRHTSMDAPPAGAKAAGSIFHRTSSRTPCQCGTRRRAARGVSRSVA